MRNLICITLLIISGGLFSQIYVGFSPTISTSIGSIQSKINPSVEVGYQYDVFSLGVVMGRTSIIKMKNDTTFYNEFRTNLNVFQQGKFTNTITIGEGVIYKSKDYLLTELTYTIEYEMSERIHFNLLAGQYFYSGETSMINETVVGMSVMYYFKAFKK